MKRATSGNTPVGKPQTAKAPIKSPTKRKHRKLDTEKVQELAAQGLNCTDIAQHQGVAVSTIWRYLEQINPQNKAIADFKHKRADVFALIQAKGINLLDKLIDSYTDESLSQMSGATKNGLIGTLNNVVGTVYDKERLETGKTTANIGTLVAHIEAIQRGESEV